MLRSGMLAEILLSGGWLWDEAADAWLTPDGLTHADWSEAWHWASRRGTSCGRLRSFVFSPVSVAVVGGGE